MTKSNVKTVFSKSTRIYWGVFHFSVTNIKSTYDVEKWKKDIFYDLRQLTNLLWQWRATWKWDLSHTCFNSSGGQESSYSLAKNNFVRATFQKFGAVCDSVRKNAEASTLHNLLHNLSKIKTLARTLHINGSWLNNKTEKV